MNVRWECRADRGKHGGSEQALGFATDAVQRGQAPKVAPYWLNASAVYRSRASFFVNVTLRPSDVRTFARTVTVVPVKSAGGRQAV